MRVSEILRYALGVLLMIVGLNKFFSFMPMMSLSQDASSFMQALAATAYMLPAIALVEITCGAMLLSKRTTPLSLILLAPISVNIILFHLFLDISSIWMGLFVFAVHVYLIGHNRDFYLPIISSITEGKYPTEKKLQKMKEFKVSSTPAG